MKCFGAALAFCLAMGGVLPPSSSASPAVVFVGVAPLQRVVQEVAGSDYEVRILLPSGASPATYEPQARQIAALADSRVLFTLGLPFERVLTQKLARGAVTSDVVALAPTNNDGDPHLWLDPLAMVAMAERSAEWFAADHPDSAAAIGRRVARVAERYRALEEEVRQQLSRGTTTRAFATVHPAYGAFAERFHLRQIALERDGRVPSGRGLTEALEEIRRAGVHLLLTQPQHSARQAESIARELGLEMLEIDPLAPNVKSCILKLVAALVAPAPDS